jgi:hypothetical protein
MSYVTYSCIPRYRVQYLLFLSALVNETAHCSDYITVMNEWISLDVSSNDAEREETSHAKKKNYHKSHMEVPGMEAGPQTYRLSHGKDKHFS